MRRVLFLTAGLLALSCSHRARTESPAAAQRAPAESAIAVSSIPELAPRNGETVVARDVGGRGKPDFWVYSVLVAEGQERAVRRERDLNGDGRVDVWEALDDEGNVVKQAYDLDFDGKPDLVITYEKGQLVKKEFAPGFDGMPRTTAFYENGKLVRKERDTKGTGKIDTWEYWENGELDRVGVDLDGDGQVDRWDRRPGSSDTDAEAAEKEAAEKEGGDQPAQDQADKATPPDDQPAKADKSAQPAKADKAAQPAKPAKTPKPKAPPKSK